MRLWACSLREIQRRPGRTLLTLLGITLGLATVVASGLTSQTVSRAYRDLFETISGAPSLEVTAPGLASFDPHLADSLARVPGVRLACPRIHGAATLVGKKGGVSTPLLGIDPSRTEEMPLRQGEPLGEGEVALLDAGLASEVGVGPGDLLRLWTPEGPAELRLGGILAPRKSPGGPGGLLVVSLKTAQGLLNLQGRVNSLRLLLAEDADSGTVQRAVSGLLPEGLAVHPPGRHAEMARSTLQAAEQGLAGLGVMAVVTAAFVSLNTFLLNLSERRQQLAILKTLGATRFQVLCLLLGEVLFLGVIGTIAGSAGGLGLALVLLGAMERFLGVPVPPLQLSPGPFVLAGVLGPAISLAAAGLPAWYASQRTPLAELRQRGSEREESVSLRIGWVGLALLLAGLVSATGLCLSWFSCHLAQCLVSPTLATLLGGGVLAFPLLLKPALALLRFLPLGLEGHLAGQQLARHQTRTGLTAGVLFLALAVAIGFGHSLRGILRDLHDWYHQTIVADFLVRGSLPDTAFLLASALPESLGEELARVEGVARVERLSFLPGQGGGKDVLILARTFFAEETLPLDVREGDPEAVKQGLLAGEVVLGAGLAEGLGLHVGDTFSLTTARGVIPLKVAGTATEFAAGGSALYLEWEAARKLLEVPGVHVFLVSAREGQAGKLGGTLDDFCAKHQLQLQSNAELRSLIENSLVQVTGVIWALLALIFVVASLGIVNTLFMNLRDQLRAFSVLRVLGFRGGQIGRLVVMQSLLLGVVSVPPGVLAGMGLAYLISRSSGAWAGMPISFRPDGAVIAGCCGLALGSALLASLWQARRAATQSILRGLQGG